MRGFVLLASLLGVFIYLVLHFSFWAVFGGMYMMGMIVVGLIACFGRRQMPIPQAWDGTSETEQA